MVWVKNVVWWQVHPLGFVGAPQHADQDSPEIAHRFDVLTTWLDHVVELGCTGVMLGPVFASASDGDDPVDHFRIDPRLGDLDDFDRFVLEAKARGLRICLEAGFTHVSVDSSAYRTAVKKGKRAPEAELFRIRYPKGWEPGQEPERQGVKDEPIVVLDHSVKDVAAHVVNVMRYWLSRGVDGWILPGAGDVPGKFWASVLPKVGRKHSKVWSVGEFDREECSELVDKSKLRSATQNDLCDAIRAGLRRSDLTELAAGIRRHGEVSAAFAPHTFVGNSRKPRIADEVGDELALVAAAVLFTMPGSPSIYYGDEFGFSAGHLPVDAADDPVRPTMPGRPCELDGMGARAYEAHRALIRLRARHPWLFRCSVEVDEVSADRIVYTSLPDRGKAAAKAEGQALRTEICLTGTMRVRITDVDGHVEFTLGE